jgi:hypothetical protein
MAPTSRKQKTKTGTDVASEVGMSKKPDQAPVIKDKQAVTARPRKPATSVKSSPGIQENEKRTRLLMQGSKRKLSWCVTVILFLKPNTSRSLHLKSAALIKASR